MKVISQQAGAPSHFASFVDDVRAVLLQLMTSNFPPLFL
jgi:hypothetical protein